MKRLRNRKPQAPKNVTPATPIMIRRVGKLEISNKVDSNDMLVRLRTTKDKRSRLIVIKGGQNDHRLIPGQECIVTYDDRESTPRAKSYEIPKLDAYWTFQSVTKWGKEYQTTAVNIVLCHDIYNWHKRQKNDEKAVQQKLVLRFIFPVDYKFTKDSEAFVRAKLRLHKLEGYTAECLYICQTACAQQLQTMAYIKSNAQLLLEQLENKLDELNLSREELDNNPTLTKIDKETLRDHIVYQLDITDPDGYLELDMTRVDKREIGPSLEDMAEDLAELEISGMDESANSTYFYISASAAEKYKYEDIRMAAQKMAEKLSTAQ